MIVHRLASCWAKVTAALCTVCEFFSLILGGEKGQTVLMSFGHLGVQGFDPGRDRFSEASGAQRQGLHSFVGPYGHISQVPVCEHPL